MNDGPEAPRDADAGLVKSMLAETGEQPVTRANTFVSTPAPEKSGYEPVNGESAPVPVSVETPSSSATPERYGEGPLLGAGGMGEVRLHKDTRTGRSVAIKRLHSYSQGDEAGRRFLREARIQAQLEHPAIVPVYDLDFDAEGQPFFTMKRVRGQTLGKIIGLLSQGDEETTRRFGRRRLLSAFVQVCHALHYAHVRGVVHRDMKPGNIMLGDYGEVYVLDWGVARLIHGEVTVGQAEDQAPVSIEDRSFTQRGSVLGSVGYMAPEQMSGNPAAIDARADVFALGVVLFEMLTLTRYREGSRFSEVIVQVLRGENKKAIDIDPNLPPELSLLCERCTAREANDRPQTAGEIAEALERFLEGDRDREVRRALAAGHATSATRRMTQAAGNASERVEATREVVKALSLDPDNGEAQALLLELFVNVSGQVPPEAEADFSTQMHAMRVRGARLSTFGFAVMLLTFPMAFWLGVKSWTAIALLSAQTIVAGLFAWYASAHGAKEWHSHVMALLAGMVAAVSSCLFGPFVMVPTMAACMAMYFVAHVSPKERRVAIGLITLGALLPYVLEFTGWGPRAYTFEPERLVLHARAVNFPKIPILLGLIYSSATFVLLPSILAGRMHDQLMAAQRRMSVQAWQLKQLFPTRRPAAQSGE